jgi:four helix bundle protein
LGGESIAAAIEWCRSKAPRRTRCGMSYRNLRVLAAAEEMVVEVVTLFDRPRPARRRLLFKAQTLDSAQSVPANIGEAFGRTTLADRNRVLGIACGEAEETIRHLKANVSANRLDARSYWPLHNRLVTIVKMLKCLMN